MKYAMTTVQSDAYLAGIAVTREGPADQGSGLPRRQRSTRTCANSVTKPRA